MDNNELDKILREKLNCKIKPSAELEAKIRQKVEEEKAKKLKTINIANGNNKNKNNKYKKIKSIISVAAAVVIVSTVGINLDKIPQLFLNESRENVTLATIKTIEPTKRTNGILANDSEFIIYADGKNIDTESVQKSLYVEPALDYTIEKVKNGEYKLKFKQNIPDNTIVKLQYIKDKITKDSWAYQTSNKLSINSTYPANDSNSVSKNTAIEIQFSYASVENLENYVDISPNVEGKWEHLGKIWRFTPNNELKENQKYFIKVKKGITAEGEILEDDYAFSFTVNEFISLGETYTYNTISVDGIATYKSDEAVKIFYNYNEYTKSKIEISKIKISKFKTTDEFIEYVKTKNYSNSELLGEYNFKQNEGNLQLDKTLQNGYYVASVQTEYGYEIFNCPIQINDLSGYAVETERDVLVWVAEGDNLAKDIKVEYLGKEIKTNAQGIAKFEDIADNSESIKYLTLGNTDNKLVVGIYNYNLDNYPSAYLYTDRPLYKNTDTINIWGFVPRKLFYDKIENEFYIELGSEGKQKIEVGEDGNLNYKIELNNHIDSTYQTIKLYYKDTVIANREITIENYELQNYTYQIITNKNYVYSGNEFEFDVKVNHITGLTVPNKSIVATYDGKNYRETTDENGIAHFSIYMEKEGNSNIALNYQVVSIYNGDASEYVANYVTDINVWILTRNTYTQIEKKDKTTYKVTLHKLSENKNAMVDYGLLDELYDELYNTNVKINLVEEAQKRYISGYKYNEYKKENEPEYYYETSSDSKYIKTVNTQNGTYEFSTNELEFQKDTEETTYNYHLEFIYKDLKGREVKEEQYLYNRDEYNQTSLGYVWFGINSSDSIAYLTQIDTRTYYTYRYLLKKDKDKFKVGDTVNFTLAESTEDGIKDIQNDGKLLKIVLKEDITKADIIEDNNTNYTFTDEDVPGCKITSAYFYKGKFYRMPVYYFDFNEEDRKVDVEINSDKEQYKPGDKVTLTVKTTNKGNPIQSYVNISVINKAVFELKEDITDILEKIYLDKSFPIYTYSSYRDFISELEMGGEGGGDGKIRGDFGDTAHFETVYTDSKGIATVSFTLPDNVTTYTATAHSANKDLYVGVNTKDIVSKLDFFVQSTQPRNVKTTDDLVLNATSIAEEKYDVEYEFTIKELNKTKKTEATTNSIVAVNFGKLPYGKYHAIIKGKHENQEDAIEYEFNIVESTQEVKDKKTVSINETTTIRPSKNPVVLEIYNKNMSQYLKYINFVESTLTQRLDTQIAYNKIQSIKNKYYNTQSPINYIDLSKCERSRTYFKNLQNGKEDILLTALISNYAKEYYSSSDLYTDDIIPENTNIFEFYLLEASKNKPVLVDLLYLKQENDIDNYSKLLVTLSLEFLGDFQNAKELYNTIDLTDYEKEEYKSINAIINTYINKENAVKEINELIENSPSDEYLRFAILAFFENNSEDIAQRSTVNIVSKNLNETLTINGMQVNTYVINNEDLDTIKFETSSNDLMVSYYYQTLLDNIESKNISKDMNIKIDGNLKKDNIVKLVVEFNENIEGEIRVALPNSLRLDQSEYDYSKYYLINNQIDYATFFKTKKCNRMEIPLIVTFDGDYKFENIVSYDNGVYHISNSLDLEISE